MPPKKKKKQHAPRDGTSQQRESLNTTTPPTASRPRPSTTSPTELQKIASLLAQIWRRNKNQHGSQSWWKWLGLLKRRVRDLLKLGGDEGRSTGGIASSDASRVMNAEAMREQILKRREVEGKRLRLREWIREAIVPGAWLAFSNLVAQKQFAVLGVVLLAIVARVGRVVGLPHAAAVDHTPRPGLVQKAETVVVASSLRQTGIDVGEVVERTYDGGGGGGGTDVVRDREKVVSRDGIAGKSILEMEVDIGQEEEKDGQEPKLAVTTTNNSKASMEVVSSSTPEGDVMRQKKTRWKNGNAIDDLFGALI